MDTPIKKILAGMGSAVLFLWAGGGIALPAQPTATPDSMNVLVDKAVISTDGLSISNCQSPSCYTVYDGANGPVDVMNPAESTRTLQKGNIQVGSYRMLYLKVTEIDWHATWSPSNPTNHSPCDGSTSGEANGTVDLGGHNEFYFMTADLGGNTLAYYLAHPPLSGYAGDAGHPFILASPIQVANDGTTTVNLVIGVENTITCDGLDVFDLSGSPKGTVLAGPSTRLSGANGVYFDNNEIGITNSGNDSVTVYKPDASLLRTLIGRDTRLNAPAGIAVDANNDEIIVANRGNNSITVYNRTASGDSPPIRTISGFFTELKSPAGVALDSINDEILVANGGDNTVNFYDRLSSDNAAPLRSISGLSNPEGIAIYPDPDNLSTDEEIVVTNHSPDNSVRIFSRNDILAGVKGVLIGAPVLDAGLSVKNGYTLTLRLNGDTVDRQIVFPGDLTNGNDIATQIMTLVQALAPNLPPSLQTAYGGFTAAFDGTDPANQHYILTSGAPAPNSAVLITGGTKADDFMLTAAKGAVEKDGSYVSPKWTIHDDPNDPLGPLTQLNDPAGVTYYNNEIIVANRGGNTVTIYNRSAVKGSSNGNVAPSHTISSLFSPTAVYLDAANNEFGVVHQGQPPQPQQPVMAFIPSMSPSSANEDAFSSPLFGEYNIVVYGVDLKGVNGFGIPITVEYSERGTATFNPGTLPWPSFIINIDTHIWRQILEASPDCSTTSTLNVSEDQNGFYGVNQDGGFYAFLPNAGGSLQGAFLPDGSAFTASLYSSSNRLFFIQGVRLDQGSGYLTSDGTQFGRGAHYSFTSYRNDQFTIGRFDANAKSHDSLEYMVGIGMAQTPTLTPTVNPTIAASGDANILLVFNPMGDLGPPSGGITYTDGLVGLTIPDQGYHPNSARQMEIQSQGIAGAVSTDGSKLIFMETTSAPLDDPKGCTDDIGFGMGLRQKPGGTFHAGSLRGAYFIAGFGDRFDGGTMTSQHGSTGATITFDGAGNAKMAFIKNEGGMISQDQALFTYQVSSQLIPKGGDTQWRVDVVDLYDRTQSGPYASALIGEDGKSLVIYRSLNPRHTPNLTRLLGLGLFQHN
jgi:hypothetical protein